MGTRELIKRLLDCCGEEYWIDKEVCIKIYRRSPDGCAIQKGIVPITMIGDNDDITFLCIEESSIKWKEIW